MPLRKRHSLPEIIAHERLRPATDAGGGVKPAILDERFCPNSARRKNSSINPVVVRSAVGVRQGIDARGDELWLDASPRDALGFAVMARVRTEGPMPSAAAPLTPLCA
jgi:hypothetical protein